MFWQETTRLNGVTGQTSVAFIHCR